MLFFRIRSKQTETFVRQFILLWTMILCHWVIIWIDLNQHLFVILRNSYHTDDLCGKIYSFEVTHNSLFFSPSVFCSFPSNEETRLCDIFTRYHVVCVFFFVFLMKTDGCKLANKHSNINLEAASKCAFRRLECNSDGISVSLVMQRAIFFFTSETFDVGLLIRKWRHLLCYHIDTGQSNSFSMSSLIFVLKKKTLAHILNFHMNSHLEKNNVIIECFCVGWWFSYLVSFWIFIQNLRINPTGKSSPLIQKCK